MSDLSAETVHGIGLSMASFIAEIDASSAHVAAYIEQRLAPLVELADGDSRIADVLRLIAADSRKLTASEWK